MLIQPAILPDELASGYCGRVTRLNGFGGASKTFDSLLTWMGKGDRSRREVSTVELLAAVAGLDVMVFVRNHTSLPLRRAILGDRFDVPHGSSQCGSVLWASAMREARPSAYFCNQCVTEDEDFHGIAYWRREHQLPGLYWCPKHGCPLNVVDNANAVWRSPSAFIGDSEQVDTHWVEALQRSQSIQTFLAVESALISRKWPLNESAVSKAVRKRARALDLQSGRGATRQRFTSDLVREKFDSRWLACVDPGLISTSRDGASWCAVDRAAWGRRSGISTTTYVIALAVLFDCEAEALGALISTVDTSEVCQAQGPRRQWNDEAIRAAYIEGRGIHRGAASILNGEPTAINKRLRSLGLPGFGNSALQGLQRAAAAFILEEMPLQQASEKAGVSMQDLERMLRQAAAPLGTALAAIQRKAISCNRPRRLKPSAAPHQAPKFATNSGAVQPLKEAVIEDGMALAAQLR